MSCKNPLNKDCDRGLREWIPSMSGVAHSNTCDEHPQRTRATPCSGFSPPNTHWSVYLDHSTHSTFDALRVSSVVNTQHAASVSHTWVVSPTANQNVAPPWVATATCHIRLKLNTFHHLANFCWSTIMDTLAHLQTFTSVVTDSKQTTFAETDTKFHMACQQLVLLNNSIRELQVRFDRAVSCNNQRFRYNVRLRLISLEGMRNALHQYATHLADKLDDLEDQLDVQNWRHRPWLYKALVRANTSSQKGSLLAISVSQCHFPTLLLKPPNNTDLSVMNLAPFPQGQYLIPKRLMVSSASSFLLHFPF